METTDSETNQKILQANVRFDPELFAIVDRFRTEEDRSMSNMIAVLLKTHPRVQPLLDAAVAEAA